MELMMLTHIAPRSTHKTFGDWGEFLWSIYISPWLAFAGSNVCLLSDHPKKHSIKSLEIQRRGQIDEDQRINFAINSDTLGTQRWESVLAKAGNKRAICEFLGQFFLRKDDLYHLIKGFLFQATSRGKMPCNCCFQVNSENVNPLAVPDLYCDHEDTGIRAFFFTANSPLESTSLVISFDTDLINTGLSTLDRLRTRTVIFRYNRYGSDKKY